MAMLRSAGVCIANGTSLSQAAAVREETESLITVW